MWHARQLPRSILIQLRGSCLAGAGGIEPTQTVLETVVLPLYDAPMVTNGIIQESVKNGRIHSFKDSCMAFRNITPAFTSFPTFQPFPTFPAPTSQSRPCLFGTLLLAQPPGLHKNGIGRLWTQKSISWPQPTLLPLFSHHRPQALMRMQ